MTQPSTPRDPHDNGPKPPFDEKEQSSPGHETAMRTKPDHGEDSYEGHGRLTDRVALITGADSGIGRAVALAYAREGADVAIAYLNEHDDAQETKRVVEAAGRKAVLIAADFAEAKECKRVVEEAVKAFGRIDILVNNAAYQGKNVSGIEEMDDARIERAFRVNILAMFSLVRESLPHMKPGAVIINTASIQAYDPSPPIVDYASTKGAIVTFTKGLSQSLVDKGIRVNAVAPGPVWTPLIAQSYPKEKLDQFGSQSKMKRPAQPKELAPSYVFLASNDAMFVNGEILGVTGGGLLA